ncbi:dihydrofolate reductase family protein [Nocardia cyriacigeorgica]|uniref:dihydrofolate reductase family protein n=1 Tax=Nocardia cyriacigeorgica TaxID=135487 RepID=UPI0015B42291|nr:dihydrofolate reductase family protein [Nocardia cyriacigeorgica]
MERDIYRSNFPGKRCERSQNSNAGLVYRECAAWSRDGATLAAAAITEDLIDEYRRFVYPVIVGLGTPFNPPRAEPPEPELVESRALSPRVASLRHRRTRRVPRAASPRRSR